jgi:hypothetical protein
MSFTGSVGSVGARVHPACVRPRVYGARLVEIECERATRDVLQARRGRAPSTKGTCSKHEGDVLQARKGRAPNKHEVDVLLRWADLHEQMCRWLHEQMCERLMYAQCRCVLLASVPLCAARCVLLRAARCVLLDACCSMCAAACCSMRATRCVLLDVCCCVLLDVCCSMRAARCVLLRAARCVLFDACCSPVASAAYTRQLSLSLSLSDQDSLAYRSSMHRLRASPRLRHCWASGRYSLADAATHVHVHVHTHTHTHTRSLPTPHRCRRPRTTGHRVSSADLFDQRCEP